MQVLNAFKTASDLPTIWERTPDGFLRVKARTLKEGIMPYSRNELSNIPPELDGVDPIMMLVPMDAMSSGETLRSLEGARVVAPEHEWVDPSNAVISKGSAAGAARLEGPFHCIDLLVTDPITIEKIENRELGEISGGYHAESTFTPGTWNGQEYHAVQNGIVYNHVAILHPGEGRGGCEVRIMNQKVENASTVDYRGYTIIESNGKCEIFEGENLRNPVEKATSITAAKTVIDRLKDNSGIQNKNQGGNAMSVKVQLKNTGKFINTDEEGAAAIADESKASEAAAGEVAEGSGKKLEELMAEVEALNAQIAGAVGADSAVVSPQPAGVGQFHGGGPDSLVPHPV